MFLSSINVSYSNLSCPLTKMKSGILYIARGSCEINGDNSMVFGAVGQSYLSERIILTTSLNDRSDYLM